MTMDREREINFRMTPEQCDQVVALQRRCDDGEITQEEVTAGMIDLFGREIFMMILRIAETSDDPFVLHIRVRDSDPWPGRKG